MAVNFAKLPTSCAQVRLRRYPRKHRSGVGQFRRIRYSYRLDSLREIFCQCHDMQGKRSFFGRGTWDIMFFAAFAHSQASNPVQDQ